MTHRNTAKLVVVVFVLDRDPLFVDTKRCSPDDQEEGNNAALMSK